MHAGKNSRPRVRRDHGPRLDFAVIGAAKAGTTALFSLLDAHPALFLPEIKELPYFASPSHSYYDSYYKSPREFYADVFRRRRPGQLCGTVTPQYLFGWPLGTRTRQPVMPAGSPEAIVPGRIRDAYPDARLIAVLRDPVARARSHHRMVKMAGHERRSFDDTIDELLRPEALRDSRAKAEVVNGYVVHGEYGRLLQAYFDAFPREQLLVLFHDDLERDPAALCVTLFDFLGVDPDFRPPTLGRRYNEGSSRRRLAWLDPMALQRRVAHSPMPRSLWRRLPPSLRLRVLRGFDLTAWRLFLWNRVPVGSGGEEPDPASPETLARLRAHYREDGQRLRALLGVIPAWERTDALTP